MSDISEEAIIQVIKSKKPYLFAIDAKVSDVQFGSILVEVVVRNGSVDKMDFKEINKSWLREKSS